MEATTATATATAASVAKKSIRRPRKRPSVLRVLTFNFSPTERAEFTAKSDDDSLYRGWFDSNKRDELPCFREGNIGVLGEQGRGAVVIQGQGQLGDLSVDFIVEPRA